MHFSSYITSTEHKVCYTINVIIIEVHFVGKHTYGQREALARTRTHSYLLNITLLQCELYP